MRRKHLAIVLSLSMAFTAASPVMAFSDEPQVVDNEQYGAYSAQAAELDHNLSIDPRLNVPLIGIGAPSISWLKDVADYFGCELILPENYDVANAVGTITGSVSETAVVTVKASPYDLSDDPECSVFSINGKRSFDKIDPSVDYAIAEGKRIAEEKAIGSGATEILFNVDIERISKDLVGDGIQRFREAIVRVTATGKPPLLRN